MSGDFPEAQRASWLDRLAADRINLAAQRKQIDELIAQVDADLLNLLRTGEDHAVAQGAVKVVATRRFSAQRAAAVLTPEQLDAISVKTPSASLAKDSLPPVLYDLCRDAAGSPSVRVVPA